MPPILNITTLPQWETRTLTYITVSLLWFWWTSSNCSSPTKKNASATSLFNEKNHAFPPKKIPLPNSLTNSPISLSSCHFPHLANQGGISLSLLEIPTSYRNLAGQTSGGCFFFGGREGGCCRENQNFLNKWHIFSLRSGFQFVDFVQKIRLKKNMTSSNRWTGRCKQQKQTINIISWAPMQTLSTSYHPSCFSDVIMENYAWESSRFREDMQFGDKLAPQNILEAIPSSTSVLSVLWELKSLIAFRFQQQKTIAIEGQRLSPHLFSCFGPVKARNFD